MAKNKAEKTPLDFLSDDEKKNLFEHLKGLKVLKIIADYKRETHLANSSAEEIKEVPLDVVLQYYYRLDQRMDVTEPKVDAQITTGTLQHKGQRFEGMKESGNLDKKRKPSDKPKTPIELSSASTEQKVRQRTLK